MSSDERPVSLEQMPDGFHRTLGELKRYIYESQQRAAFAANVELIRTYHHIGGIILEHQSSQGWGGKVVQRLSEELRKAFPEARGFSYTNLNYMLAFARAWDDRNFPTAVGKLPWGHNLVLLTKLNDRDERLWYAEQSIENGWSRNVLQMQIESRAIHRWGQAVTNFERTIAKPGSDLARESLKDPYKLDFLGLGNEAAERAIEHAMVEHVEEFLLELGAGFAFVGRQVHMEVGGDDFFIDLLFYHLKLHCYVVIEVKKGKFKPEYLGQLRFYLAAVDGEVADDRDDPTIGLLLCETKNKVVAEYALQDESKPMGIAAYELTNALPTELKTNLPSIEQIENELGGGENPTAGSHDGSGH